MKVLEIREYDTIISEDRYVEGMLHRPLPDRSFQDLIKFIAENHNPDTDNDAMDFMSVRPAKKAGLIATAKNYVGLIQMENGWQIQILPKIDFSDGAEKGTDRTKKVFLKMLRSMKDFPSKIFTAANLNVDRMNLYEIFISMYIQEVRKLVKYGIKSDYIEKEDNLNFYKGKLKLSEHIRQNMVHRERFYVSYDEFNPDRPENRLVKSTLLKLQGLTESAKNAREIRQLIVAFETVSESKNYEMDFSKVKLDRNTIGYETLMKWSRIFLFNKSFTTFEGSNNSRALLFPMNKVFEDYVAKNIKKVFTLDGWKVSVQDKEYSLFSELLNNGRSREIFKLIPDIVIKKGERTIIMDTKWKRLIPDSRKNYGISQIDMYQMYAYGNKYNSKEVWLLYPLNSEMNGHENIKLESRDNDLNISVCVFFVDVDKIQDSISELKSLIDMAGDCI